MDGDRHVGMTQARQVHDDSPVTLQAVAATYAADMTVAAMVLGSVPPAREWDLLDRGVHAMQARDWPAMLAPISRDLLRAPSVVYRLRDLMERNGLPADHLWLEVAASDDVLKTPGVVRALARRHRVGCGISLDEGFGDRALLPDLAAVGISFIVLHPASDRSVASDLSAMIIGRSLSRRARAHGITTIGPPDLDADVILPPMP
jgi:EAL domain-containing protein (putative c-di-GMP-specific phosphodiesterase class I)